MSGPASIRPAAPDLDPPKRRDGRRVVVRITLPSTSGCLLRSAALLEGGCFALFESRDKTTYEHRLISRPLLARFGAEEQQAFFVVEMFTKEQGDVIEVGERAKETQW